MFTKSFKQYKAKFPTPDFAEVIDFDDLSPSISLNNDDSVDAASFGLQPVNTWRCFKLPQHPGLIVVQNPYTTLGQRYWMARCLQDYPRKPNVVNLNAHLFAPAVIADWWLALQQCSSSDNDKEQLKEERRRLKVSMRWTTLGYHHDWETKVYSETMRAAFPGDLAKMSSFFAAVLGFDRFEAQAAIVNYYPIGTTLAGHTDHSEVNLEAPLFSFSFGQTAIFLIGGQTKNEKPTALFVKSGDVLVMSRESRICYHAVPRVMKARKEHWNDFIQTDEATQLTTDEIVDCASMQPTKRLRTEYECPPSECEMDMLLQRQVTDELYWTPFRNYLNDSRININVRQVLNEGDSGL